MIDREGIDGHCRRMKVGEWLTFDMRAFNRAYPCGWTSIYETHEQAFLSSMIGSMWGTYTVHYDGFKSAVTIKRHEEGERVVYVDPDRAHHYRKTPDGYLEPK